MLNLTCEACGNNYQKPELYAENNKTYPNVFWKWSLTYCDTCRKGKQLEALKQLPAVVKILTEKDAVLNPKNKLYVGKLIEYNGKAGKITALEGTGHSYYKNKVYCRIELDEPDDFGFCVYEVLKSTFE